MTTFAALGDGHIALFLTKDAREPCFVLRAASYVLIVCTFLCFARRRRSTTVCLTKGLPFILCAFYICTHHYNSKGNSPINQSAAIDCGKVVSHKCGLDLHIWLNKYANWARRDAADYHIPMWTSYILLYIICMPMDALYSGRTVSSSILAVGGRGVFPIDQYFTNVI